MAFHPGLVGITRTVSTWPSLWTVVRTLSTQAGFPCSVVCKDSAVSCPDDAVDQLRRLLTAQKVLPHDRDGKLGNQKLPRRNSSRPSFPKITRAHLRDPASMRWVISATGFRNSGGHSPFKKSFRS